MANNTNNKPLSEPKAKIPKQGLVQSRPTAGIHSPKGNGKTLEYQGNS